MTDNLFRRPDEFMKFNCMYRGAKAWSNEQIPVSA